jgi:hypothetical protein
VAEHLLGQVLLAVGRLADREVTAYALLAFATDDGEWHDDTVTLLKMAIDTRTDFDDLAHHLVTHDVVGEHGGNEVMEEVKVRPTDRAAGHLNDGVPRILDFGVRDGVAADIFLTVPN